mmetsp:Transcript_75875/g.236182  ORF Transcript_75875/g.236182 Transcript_75875/m.236182 type:complete len:182 (+) Transcript_75875:63-608(+)|eukprot:CAMPEP_0175337774 /NCGR_PEP_ID=MMETSP0095-20121207/4501_1 /TAXON_ID=311494 /ORGANISM="Alexandrium monilatum, Strain CCMP3105" /LENGTH=181 /DNA_ID=CAMNT_0016635173 /DNA_START=63 /DNA_END=608 /DNA_ORIENTATION=-
MSASFNAFDRNHDGVITRAEFNSVMAGQTAPAMAAPGMVGYGAPAMQTYAAAPATMMAAPPVTTYAAAAPAVMAAPAPAVTTYAAPAPAMTYAAQPGTLNADQRSSIINADFDASMIYSSPEESGDDASYQKSQNSDEEDLDLEAVRLTPVGGGLLRKIPRSLNLLELCGDLEAVGLFAEG